MDEVRIVRHRTHVWPVIIALIVLAIVIGYVFFAKRGPASQVGSNGAAIHAVGRGVPTFARVMVDSPKHEVRRRSAPALRRV